MSTGQRRYGGPPPNWTGAQPGPGHEVMRSFFSFFNTGNDAIDDGDVTCLKLSWAMTISLKVWP